MKNAMKFVGMELLDCLKFAIQKTLTIATALWILSYIANAEVVPADYAQIINTNIDDATEYVFKATTPEAICGAMNSDIPRTGEELKIGDYSFIVIGKHDWTALTNSVAEVVAVHEKMMETEEGRTAVHGKRGHTTITNGYIEVEYADGYIRRETVKANATKRGPVKKSVERKRFRNPSKLEEILKRREAAKKPREVVETVGGAK